MRIESFYQFASIASFEALDIPDLTLIHGPNGAGKTHFLLGLHEGALRALEGDKILSVSYASDFKDFNPLQYQRPQAERWHHEQYDGLKRFLQESVSITNFIKRETTELQRQAFGPQGRLELVDLALKKKIETNKAALQAYNNELIEELSRVLPELSRIASNAAESSGLAVHELSLGDFANPESSFTSEFIRPTLGRIFYSYIDQLRAYVHSNVRKNPDYKMTAPEAAFTERFGQAPWEAYNEGLAKLGIEFKFNVQLDESLENPQIYLNKGSSSNISFDSVSAGERVLLSFALATMTKAQGTMRVVRPDVLLLDEPDAHLHPALVKDFFALIIEPLIAEGTKIIITTHSPTTVALAPENSIFRKIPNSGLERTTKQEAIDSLLEGVPHLALDYSGRRQVFTESTLDARVYQRLYELNRSRLLTERSLTFIGVGAEVNGGKDRVKSIVKTLRSSGNGTIYGLIDWDCVEPGDSYISVSGQSIFYGIENIILNPFYIAAALLRAKSVDYFPGHKFSLLPSIDGQAIQSLADIIIDRLEFDRNCGNTFLHFVEGGGVSIPNSLLLMDAHAYEKMVVKIFPALTRLPTTSDKCLKWMIADQVLSEFPKFCPEIINSSFEYLLR
ncbi:putative ATPase [Pseudacidovorax sp. 1753]|uniref:AAA family ATPase n=1 Tax=Pseudacidovorax sp. 1753 TaxID=3156419 RepID=UPI00339626A9